MSNEQSTTRKRLPPAERRAQLLDIASKILAEEGADQLRVPNLAERAGVTRPVVYRFFENRQAIVHALVEEFANHLETEFDDALSVQDTELGELVRRFVNTTCDVIQEHGPGAWLLLSGVAFDGETGEHVAQIEERLSAPWQRRVARVTNVDGRTADAVASVLVSSSRAVLRLWIQRKLEREEVVEVLHRCVRALLEEFRR
jgi:AcrR family transcriptional regulator